jgi:hypothetical protein
MHFLGIEVTLTNMSLMLSQHKYVIDILYRVGTSSFKQGIIHLS